MIYIAGGTSFLGQRVVKRFLEEKYDVTCLSRSEETKNKLFKLKEKYNGNLNIVSGNLQNPNSLFYGLTGVQTAIYLVRLEYTDYVKNFIYSAKKLGVKRVVFISSTTVLLPYDLDVKKQKLESEEMIKNSGLDYTILRPTMIYGGEGDNNFSKMLKFIKTKKFFVVFGNGENLIQPIYVDDVASAIISVLDNEKTIGKTYEICGKEPIKYIEMLKIVKDKLKSNFMIIRLSIGFSKFVVKVFKGVFKNFDLDVSQIEGMKIDKAYSYEDALRDFGFNPLPFEVGIEKEIKELGY